MKKWFLKLSSPILVASPFVFVSSCSTTLNYSATNNSNLYSTIWNLANNKILKKSIFDLTVSELENNINNELKNNDQNNFMTKIYCFSLLWNAIKNPLSSSGSSQTNLSSEISEFASFLSSKVDDDTNQTLDSNKTFNNLKQYIKTFDYKIRILNFSNNQIDNSKTLREIFDNGEYVLNFQFEFWTSDEETNKKMISKNNNEKSIMFKNNLTREQREIISKISNKELKNITTKQFNYQSTKLFYDVENKKFSSIVLPSNIYNGLKENTPNSGYSISDKQRQLFIFNWYTENSNSTKFQSNLDFLLDNKNNFDTSLSNDWKLFLEKEGLLTTNSSSTKTMKKIKINLNKNFEFNLSDYE